MSETWENSKKTNFGLNFCLFGPNLALQIFFAGFISTSSKALFQAIILCNIKEN